MAKILSFCFASLSVLLVGISEQAYGEDAEFCSVFNQYYADRASGFINERGARSETNDNLWTAQQSLPDMPCSIGDQFVQCKYTDPGPMGEETLSRHKAMAAKVEECLSKIPGLQKTQVKRAHDTDTSGARFYLSEGWEVGDAGGTYAISLIRTGLVLMYVQKH